MDHSTYSPGVDPFDSWLFPKLKDALEGQRVADIPDVQRKVPTLVRGIPSVPPSSDEVHVFTRIVFRRRQQRLVHK
jgi:hypothetical protein